MRDRYVSYFDFSLDRWLSVMMSFKDYDPSMIIHITYLILFLRLNIWSRAKPLWSGFCELNWVLIV